MVYVTGVVMVWAILSRHTLVPSVSKEHSLTTRAYISIHADHLFTTTVYPSYYRIMHHITKLKVTLNWTLDFSSVGFLWDVTEWDLNEKQMYKGVTNDVSGVCILLKIIIRNMFVNVKFPPKSAFSSLGG